MPTQSWPGHPRPSDTMPKLIGYLPRICEPHPQKTTTTQNQTQDYQINTTNTRETRYPIHRNREKRKMDKTANNRARADRPKQFPQRIPNTNLGRYSRIIPPAPTTYKPLHGSHLGDSSNKGILATWIEYVECPQSANVQTTGKPTTKPPNKSATSKKTI